MNCIYHPDKPVQARCVCHVCYNRIWRGHHYWRDRAITESWQKQNQAHINLKQRERRATLEGHRKHILENTENCKKRRKESPAFKLLCSLRHRLWSALSGHGLRKHVSTIELLGASVREVKIHLENKFQPEMSWENYGTYWHIDHITPCAAFNLEDPEQQRVCFHYTNLQPLTREENLRKGATI